LVLCGGTIEKLSVVLGHYSVTMTERYAHLRPDLFPVEDLATVAVDLRPGRAKPGTIGHQTGTGARKATASTEKQKKMARAAL
jgi:hypothetical protein